MFVVKGHHRVGFAAENVPEPVLISGVAALAPGDGTPRWGGPLLLESYERPTPVAAVTVVADGWVVVEDNTVGLAVIDLATGELRLELNGTSGEQVLTAVTCAPIARTIRRIRSEVEVGADEGLSETSVISCDNIITIPQAARVAVTAWARRLSGGEGHVGDTAG